MKTNIEIDIPETKYHKSDVIEVRTGSFSVFLYISRIIYMGNFSHCPACGKSFSNVNEIKYEGVVQRNSRDCSGNIIRSGQRILYTIDELENFERIDNFPYQIVSGDTKENIRSRQKEWRSKICNKEVEPCQEQEIG